MLKTLPSSILMLCNLEFESVKNIGWYLIAFGNKNRN